ncbi:hypothetical protein [Oleiharenicola lentus]|uniref:hypothetical protein n=1 Tax=Oleiharenicola lentus TaxID=2508720 RepID=UPI003F66CBB8
MKVSRILLIGLGAGLVLGAVVIGLALTPAVQRWAVLRATAGTPGLKLELERVSAGISRAELSNVKVEQDGLVIQVARLEAEYSLTQYLFSDRLKIARLAASGVVIDATRFKSANAAAAGAPVAAPGVLANITLPFELVLDDVQLEGSALLPASANSGALRATFKVSGGRFAPGQEGSLALDATIKDPAPTATVSVLRAQVNLRATPTVQRGFEKIAATAVVNAEGKGLPAETQLKVVTELARSATGENYTVSVDTSMSGAAENVATLQASLENGKQEFSGQWTLKARKAQIAPFFLGGILPEFEVRGDGRFTFAPATLALSLQGKFDSTVSRLELIEPSWRAIGTLKSSVVFDVAEANKVVKLNALKIALSGEKPVLDLQAKHAASFDLVKGVLQVGGAGATEVLDLQLHGLPVAWIRPFVSAADISGDVVKGRFIVLSENKNLILRSTQPLQVTGLNVVQSGLLLLSKADISLRPEIVFSGNELKATVKEFSLRAATGDSLTADATVNVPVPLKPPFVVTANYSADLPTLLALWVPLGRIKSSGAIDFTLGEGQVELRRITSRVLDGADAVLVNVESLRPFTIDLAQGRFVTSDTKPTDLVKISIGSMALAKLPLSQAGIQLGGTLDSGEFILSTEGAKTAVRSVAPVRLTGVSLRQDGKISLAGLTIQAQPTLEISDRFSGIAKSGEVTVKNDKGATLISLQGEASRVPVDGMKASLTFNIDVPALGSQPLFSGAQAVTQGKASGEIRAAVGAHKQVEARVTINNLVARDAAQTLPVANLSLRALVQPDGKILVQAPLLLDRAGQRSDLNFEVELKPANGVLALTGKLAGEHVELSDALAVLSVFQTSAPAGAPASPNSAPVVKNPPTVVVADQTPVWGKVNGQFLLDIKSVTHGKDWAMSGLTGTVVVEPARVVLQKLQTAFDEKSNLSANAEIKFSRGAMPYRLDGAFTLTEFDSGKLFKALDATKAPTVEGLFNVNGKFVGDGETIGRTIDRTRGQFELISRQGIFRGLQRATGKVSMATKAAEFGASVVGSLGSIFGEKAVKTAEKIGSQAAVVDQLAQSLGEFNYDQLTVKLSRDDSLNVTVEEVSLVSPEIRLIGKGTLAHLEGKSLLDYPLNVSLSLAARGKLEQLLAKAHLTDISKDELGFTKTRETVTLGGTLTKPDASAFFSKIASAKLNELISPGN